MSDPDTDSLSILRCPLCGKLATDIDDSMAFCACGHEWSVVRSSEVWIEPLLARVAALEEALLWRPADEWSDDDGDALWAKHPVHEPPYVGSPLCDDWTEGYTHWLPLSNELFAALDGKDTP